MAYVIALLLPGLGVILKGRVPLGIALIVLQITIIGWIPACLIAFAVIGSENAKEAARRQQQIPPIH